MGIRDDEEEEGDRNPEDGSNSNMRQHSPDHRRDEQSAGRVPAWKRAPEFAEGNAMSVPAHREVGPMNDTLAENLDGVREDPCTRPGDCLEPRPRSPEAGATSGDDERGHQHRRRVEPKLGEDFRSWVVAKRKKDGSDGLVVRGRCEPGHHVVYGPLVDVGEPSELDCQYDARKRERQNGDRRR